MDYNTQREKLVLPEYGRHVQKMIEQVKAIEDKEIPEYHQIQEGSMET